MKKSFIAAVFVLTFVLCSCTNKNTSENAVASSEEVTETISETSSVSEAIAEETEPTVESQFRYQEFLSHVYLDRYIGKEAVVMIPTEINGKPVTGFAADLFSNTNAREVIFPEGMTKLPYLVTTDRITKIVIPSTIEELSAKDLMYIYYLESIEVADGGNFIVDDGVLFTADRKTIVYTFGCDDEYVVPEGVENIGEYSFSHHTFRSVSLPSTLKTIGKGAFQGCNQINYMEIPSGVTEIGEGAFYSTGLVDIKLNEGLESIGEDAFNQTKLSEIQLPQSIKAVGWRFINDGCKVIAYDPIEPLFSYDAVFLNETLEEKSKRLLWEISDEANGRFFLDINFDGLPECFDCYDGLIAVFAFTDESRWINVADFEGKLYHFYDKENDCDFYVSSRLNNGWLYHSCSRLTPLDGFIQSDHIGSFNNIKTVLEYGSLNGHYYIEEKAEFPVNVDKYIPDALSEYELIEVIDFFDIAKEQSSGGKFCITLDPLKKCSSKPLQTRDEYMAENYININGIDYYKYDSQAIIQDKDALKEVSKHPKLSVLYAELELENADEIKKFKNIRELHLGRIDDPSGLADMDNIEKLYLPVLESYDFLQDMDGVRIIEFENTTSEPDDFFKCVKEMKNLQYILINNYYGMTVTYEQYHWIKENLPEVEVIHSK
ncbi:MAG: leucine-rich repeat protein [Oscillospiraceae bacterium]